MIDWLDCGMSVSGSGGEAGLVVDLERRTATFNIGVLLIWVFVVVMLKFSSHLSVVLAWGGCYPRSLSAGWATFAPVCAVAMMVLGGQVLRDSTVHFFSNCFGLF